MKAVNLIPLESRRGSGGPGKSGGAVYGLIGLLGLLVVLASAYAVSNKSIKDREAELAVVRQEAVMAEAKAGALAPYSQFATLRANRVQTVRSLVSSRFDWAHALREVSRTIPANAWLSTLDGTIAPGAGAAAGGGGAGSLRAALPVPAFEIVGCTTSHRSVSRMLARMRLIDGVQRVSLASTEKADAVGGAGAGGGSASTAGGADCRNGSDHFPKFELVVFFKAVAAPAVAAPAVTPGAPAATSTSTTTSTTTAAPAGAPAPTSGSPK